MNVGTKSLLFGAHQFLIHPFTVLLAWVHLYHKLPIWREFICILIHDWGYWGSPNMDGREGSLHPVWAAIWVLRHLDKYRVPPKRGMAPYYSLCLYHSRHMARAQCYSVSQLYYADKLSFAYVPWWLYILLARLSGELKEYRRLTQQAGQTSPHCSDREWHHIIKTNMIALSKDPEARGYLHA